MDSFYREDELQELGFKYIGKNVKLSRKAIVYNHSEIEIGDYSRIDDLCILSGKLKIGRFVHISVCCRVSGSQAGIVMEDFTGLSSNTTIITNTDDFSGEYLTNACVPAKFKKSTSAPVTLEKHALVATHCMVLPGVTIREGTAIGAMSLVNRSTEDWSIYVGTPAKRLKARKKDLLALEKKFLQEFEKSK